MLMTRLLELPTDRAMSLYGCRLLSMPGEEITMGCEIPWQDGLNQCVLMTCAHSEILEMLCLSCWQTAGPSTALWLGACSSRYGVGRIGRIL